MAKTYKEVLSNINDICKKCGDCMGGKSILCEFGFLLTVAESDAIEVWNTAYHEDYKNGLYDSMSE